MRVSHMSTETNTTMTCSIFLPGCIARDDVTAKLPSIWYLSGLTCSDENVCQKSGVFKKLAELGVRANYHSIALRWVIVNSCRLITLVDEVANL